uniref:Transmembrane protein 82 n=1 Tax=Mastacembelus armatus TaxID=205130 RepID=A0A3Q3NFW1_9TELE
MSNFLSTVILKLKPRTSSPSSALRVSWRTAFQFWPLTVLLSLVGPRVSSLITGSLHPCSCIFLQSGGPGLHLLQVQCQFSLGCGLTCTLVFLHQGAPHSSLSFLWSHVARLYPRHSTERYCGKCINLLTSGHTKLASLQKVVVLALGLATVASTATVYDHFLTLKDALKFWTLLTLCYTVLVVCVQAKNRQVGPRSEVVLCTAERRLGALLVLILAVGEWSDVLHVFITFLGEAVCLLPSQDQAVVKK